MSLIIPSEKDIKKAAAKRRAKLGLPVKPSKKAETELKRRMSALWKRVLLPVGDKLRGMVKDGASPSELGREMEVALRRAEIEYGIAADNIVDTWKLAVDRDTRIGIERGLRDAMGIDTAVILDNPAVRDAMSIGGMEAANLIKTVPREYLGHVARAVADNFAGKPLPEGRSLMAQIQHIGGVSERRAKIIARDQTSKLTGLLTKTRQTSIGVETYVWRSSKDQRVVGDPSGNYPKGNSKHGDHYHLDGKLCRWDDPTVYSGDGGKSWKPREQGWTRTHPGQDILCRCHARPIIDPKRIAAIARGNYDA